jgi:hypothetical protein
VISGLPVIQPESAFMSVSELAICHTFPKLSPQKPTSTEECALIKTGLRPLVCLRKSPVVLCGVTGITEFVARLS